MLHPLDPLSPSEISSASLIVRENDVGRNWIFNTISLLEPPKYEVLENRKKDTLELIPRKAVSMIIDKVTGTEYEAIVNLTSRKVESLTEISDPEAHLNLSSEDCLDAERIILENEEVKRRCALLGFTDMSLVVADAWPTGFIKDRPELLGPGKRLVRCFMYARLFEDDNMYAHPLDFTAIADVFKGKVVDIEDLPVGTDFGRKRDAANKVKVPKNPVNYDPEFLTPNFMRLDLKPIRILQPSGPSFKVAGNLVQWQKFSFRVGFNFREGLVLHDVRYQDGKLDRPLFYRMALAEMAVPYGDPRPPYHVKCALDAGDCGLGFLANSLELGCDCLGAIHYFDGVLNSHAGEPVTIKNAICLHEEDSGMLFKHTEYRNGRDVTARSRRLVISFVCSIVNYDYGFYWSFYQDGSIGFEAKATGILSTSLLSPSEPNDPHTTQFSTLVAPGVNSQFHQHLFAIRLDPMIDGVNNDVSTVDPVPLPQSAEENPYGNGFVVKETLLKNSLEAMTDTITGRFWRISNRDSLHPITGKPVGYKLMPGNVHKLLALESSYIWDKVGFARHSMWVTPYTDAIEERYPDGRFVSNRNGGYTGVHEWAQRNDNVENTDVVVWHVFGITHIPRVEDFPVMPVETASFMLKPHNFFGGNPALDVPGTNKKENGSVLATSNQEMGNVKCCHETPVCD